MFIRSKHLFYKSNNLPLISTYLFTFCAYCTSEMNACSKEILSIYVTNSLETGNSTDWIGIRQKTLVCCLERV